MRTTCRTCSCTVFRHYLRARELARHLPRRARPRTPAAVADSTLPSTAGEIPRWGAFSQRRVDSPPMFLGHYGVALAAKRVAPRVSLGVLVAAAQLADL